jgi:hypothetical protein
MFGNRLSRKSGDPVFSAASGDTVARERRMLTPKQMAMVFRFMISPELLSFE